ncbi:hypothetical protein JCM10213_004405, partial [Rhodosporidiobolus nylandii]
MGKLGMLSSQPARRWGGDSSDDENAAPSTSRAPPSSFTLTEEDWPATPPEQRPGKLNAAAAQRAEENKRRAMEKLAARKAAQVQVQAAGAGTVKGKEPLKPKPQPSFTKTDPAKLAPLFRTASASSSSSSNSRPSTSSSSAAYAYNHSSSSTRASASTSSAAGSAQAGSVLPKKRALPWEQLESLPSSSSKLARTASSNFHAVNGPPGAGRLAAGMKERMLTSEAMDIKQKVILSPEQQMVLKLVVEDEKNVFFTGSAGTGKSVLLREIISSLKRKYRGSSDAVAVTASTGMAACNIGGTTIHSFAGIGIGTGTAEQLIASIKKNRNSNAKWQRVKVLVVDEVSMVDGILFDKLAAIAQALKKRPGKNSGAGKPFGGIQLVVTGDFFQLPPVTKGQTPTFAFEAEAWKQCIDHTVNLTQVFRQKDT